MFGSPGQAIPRAPPWVSAPKKTSPSPLLLTGRAGVGYLISHLTGLKWTTPLCRNVRFDKRVGTLPPDTNERRER